MHPPAVVRSLLWIDPEVEIEAHDDAAEVPGLRRADVQVGDVYLFFGRHGAASDEQIVGLADRFIAAFGEIRGAAAARIDNLDAGNHYAGMPPRATVKARSEPWRVIPRSPQRLVVSTGAAPAHDELLHSGLGHDLAVYEFPPFAFGCAGCEFAKYGRTPMVGTTVG